MIDVIFISKGDTKQNRIVTQNAINTALNTAYYKINCVVVEQIDSVEYEHAKTLHYSFKFNYNKCLNYGVSKTKNKYILLANNDLKFFKDWDRNLIKYIKDSYSASPYSEYNPHINISNKGNHTGYVVGKHIMGWAIFVKRSIFDIIGKLDESYTFWSSDNIYAEQLKKHNLKHTFITSSRVDHICSYTLKQQKDQTEITTKQRKKFDNDMKYSTTFSIIMPSFLGEYPRCASNRNEKFLRAIKSIQAQTFKDWELLIVSDGCDITTKLYQDNFSNDKRIKCYKIPKQPIWSGKVRYAGQTQAKGKYICYLDTDDYWLKDHLQLIKDNINSLDWAYMQEYALTNEGLKERDVKLQLSSSGTSSIVHRSSLKSNWKDCDTHTHDWQLIQKLIKESDNYDNIGRCGYVVCHTQWSFDN